MRPLLILALVLLTGCVFFPRRYGHDPRTTQFGQKKVVDKRAPCWLIAGDRTTCSVSEDKYARTGIGDVVLCAWRPE